MNAQRPSSIAMTRRQILRATGAGAALLPIFPDFGNGDARAAGGPKRLIMFSSFNGTVLEEWAPTGGETDFKFGRILEPLEPHRKDVIVVGGMRNRLSETDPALKVTKACPGHTTWMHAYTGRLGDVSSAAAWNAVRGPSVDQFIAEKLNPPTKFRSIQLQVGKPGETNPVIFNPAGRPMNGDYDLAAVYKRVFGSIFQPPDVIDRLRFQNKSIIDASSKQLQALVAQQLGGDATKKLQSHLEAVRSLERSLDVMPGAGCKAPGAVDAVMATNDALPAMAKAQIDMLVAALACDLSRFISLNLLWGGQGGVKPTWLGLNEDAHTIAHESNGKHKESKILFERWHAEQFAYLLTRLKAVPEAGGNMLDNSLIMWMNMMAHGGHVPSPPAVVLAGGAGGWKMGRYLKTGEHKLGKLAEGTPFVHHNNALVSICRGMGVPVDSYGSPEYCTGPLSTLG